ncbi:FG-GAP repeat domain-containing protein [Streptomyces sp. NPDC088747]|uniref:FG-GAP repeat domain-containing protein n=1 Tax=Streptomyces sp. NPDC088747 TaxID=3365886 RepID=UPI0038015115
MPRRSFVRLRLFAASAVLAAGLTPLLPSSTALADTPIPQETVVPATYRGTYTSATLLNPDSTVGGDGAGGQGVFHRLEGHSDPVWTRYADGRSFDAPPPAAGLVIRGGTGSDVLATRYGDGHVDLWNAVDGTTSTLQVPEGQSVISGFYGSIVITLQDVTAEDGTVTKVIHLLTAGSDGSTRDVTVGGVPAGMRLGGPVRGDGTGLLFRAAMDGSPRLVVVDPGTGQVQSWSPPLPTPYSVKVSPEYLAVYGGSGSSQVAVYSRADLTAAPVEVTLDGADTATPADDLSVVGDWLVHRPGSGGVVTATPIDGGDPVTLFTSSNSGVSAGPDGSAVVIGRTGADDWGVHRIHAGEDGRPLATMVKALPKPPYTIQGLALEQGRLLVGDASWGNTRDSYVRTVAATGTPEFGARSSYDGSDSMLYNCPVTDVGCSQLHGTADDRAAWLMKGSANHDRLSVNGPAQYGYWNRNVSSGGQITDVSGGYLIHTTATAQEVLRIDNDGTAAVTRAPGAAALSGDLLWTAGATPGSVTAYDLSTRGTTETLTTDAGCAPTELQALGRYLYWTCDGRAGVYDRTAKKSVPVPAGEAKLGDGYVVTHDKRAGKLTLTTVTGGTAASRVIGELPDTGVSQRDVRWTVDESGANAAYVDDKEQVHLVPSGVPQQPLRLLGPAQNAPYVDAHEIDTTLDTLTTVLLSKPSASWRLTVRNPATGKVVDTRDGGAARGELSVGWAGDDPTVGGDVFLPNGRYDWTLSVSPADGIGAPLEVTGTVGLRNGSPVRHDHLGDDAVGDLLTLDSSGSLAFQQGTGKGTFSGKVTGTGWTTSVKAVPVGDLSGDRCNDVIVRLSSGAARLYKPGCGAALKTSTPYTTLVTGGWNGYDVLTAPGDVTKDGRPDLLARNASTGAVYLYKGTSTGKFATRVKLYDNWKTYKKVVGTGDLNGDGIGDLVAQDRTNALYRYYGTGKGTFASRVKVTATWGINYDVVVGPGDITGDGRADLVARDTAGNLYRQSGTGTGSFGTRVKIATGWQSYKGIF